MNHATMLPNTSLGMIVIKIKRFLIFQPKVMRVDVADHLLAIVKLLKLLLAANTKADLLVDVMRVYVINVVFQDSTPVQLILWSKNQPI